MKFSALATILIALVIADVGSSLNILGIFPHQGYSHFIVFREYLRELVKQGHNVTVISHFPEKNPLPNYNDITISGETIEGQVPFENSYFILLLTAYFLPTIGSENCRVMLENKQVQNLIKEKAKFDVIVLEQFNSDCALGIAYKLQAPVVGMTSHTLMPYQYNRYGINHHPAYVSYHFLEGGTKPSLYQRVERVVFDFYCTNMYYFLSQRVEQNMLAKYFDDIPPLEDLAKNIKFLLLYQNFVLSGSSLYPSNIIEVGGYHVGKAKPLTGDLKAFVDGAEHGVIFISFGSMVKAETMPADKLQAIIEAIKKLPQRVIWKWDDPSLVFDKNKIYTAEWLPQIDILAHPKTLAFLSHAGNGGLTEAIYFGVPMIAMPVMGDQPANAGFAEESGLGIQLFVRNLNAENLLNTFKKVLDPKFYQQVKELSAAWHDRPQRPIDTAIYWTEFAAKHPNLTFRSAAVDVPLYQYLYLDVIAVLLLLFSLFTLVFIVSIRKCCGSKKQKTKRS